MLSTLPSSTLELKSPMMTIISVISVALGPHQSVRRIALYRLLNSPVLVHIPVPLRITRRIRSE